MLTDADKNILEGLNAIHSAENVYSHEGEYARAQITRTNMQAHQFARTVVLMFALFTQLFVHILKLAERHSM